MKTLEAFVNGHLDLQTKISYPEHHDFLLRHKLAECSRVLDVGTGNGTFAAKLAQDHPGIHVVGIDKRRECIESCQKVLRENFEAQQVDMFSRQSSFDFSRFDGFLMRYFLLHVDHAHKILELLQQKAQRPSRFWVIDLDWSKFDCVPQHATFSKLTSLIKDFCAKVSVDSSGGQNVVPLLEEFSFENIRRESIPFSSKTIAHEDFTLYLKQEVQCYTRMMGRPVHDPETAEILKFIEEEVKSGKHQVSYGMTLVSAELR